MVLRLLTSFGFPDFGSRVTIATFYSSGISDFRKIN